MRLLKVKVKFQRDILSKMTYYDKNTMLNDHAGSCRNKTPNIALIQQLEPCSKSWLKSGLFSKRSEFMSPNFRVLMGLYCNKQVTARTRPYPPKRHFWPIINLSKIQFSRFFKNFKSCHPLEPINHNMSSLSWLMVLNLDIKGNYWTFQG